MYPYNPFCIPRCLREGMKGYSRRWRSQLQAFYEKRDCHITHLLALIASSVRDRVTKVYQKVRNNVFHARWAGMLLLRSLYMADPSLACQKYTAKGICCIHPFFISSCSREIFQAIETLFAGLLWKEELSCNYQVFWHSWRHRRAVIQRSGNLPLLPDRKLLPDQMQKLLPDSEASVNIGAPVYAEAFASAGAPVPTGSPL